MEAKKIAAEKAVEKIEDGMTVGLGSGSTAYYAIRRIGQRVQEGLKIQAVASSQKSEELAKALLIPVYDPSQIDTIDIAIDGADEVDIKANLMKGGGGSLLREKIIAYTSKRFLVVVDQSKLVQQLGMRPLPVEITPFGSDFTLKHIQALGCSPVLRTANGKHFISDNGNFIADCSFGLISDPAYLDVKLKMIPGVVETGLFPNQIVTAIWVGTDSGRVREISVHA